MIDIHSLLFVKGMRHIASSQRRYYSQSEYLFALNLMISPVLSQISRETGSLQTASTTIFSYANIG